MKKYAIGIDLGGTKILIALIEKENGNVLDFVKKKTKKDKGPKNITKKMVEGIEELLTKSNTKVSDLPGQVLFNLESV